jgi:hypothetical protein
LLLAFAMWDLQSHRRENMIIKAFPSASAAELKGRAKIWTYPI